MGLTSVFVGLISLVNDALFAYIISEDGLDSNFNPVDVSTGSDSSKYRQR